MENDMSSEEYICNLSGIRANEEEYAEFDEELGDLPLGWKEITIKERNYNPEWLVIQTIKEQQFAEALSSIEKEQQNDDVKLFLRVSIASQYASLEQVTPKYIYESKTSYIAPLERDKQIEETYIEILKTLDLHEETE